jgi:hypothetical protein
MAIRMMSSRAIGVGHVVARARGAERGLLFYPRRPTVTRIGRPPGGRLDEKDTQTNRMNRQEDGLRRSETFPTQPAPFLAMIRIQIKTLKT